MESIAICEDEKEIRLQLKHLILEKYPDIRVTEFVSAEELLSYKGVYDILFLDIQLEGMNGIEAAGKLRQEGNSAEIIFVTGVKGYVFKAFDVGAFHYLVKPVDRGKFFDVLGKAVAAAAEKNIRTIPKLVIRSDGENITININEILYISSAGRKIDVHTLTQTYTVQEKMADIGEKLDDRFYRCHRGNYVNMDYIAKYTRDTAYLKNGEMVYMAKEKYSEFLKIYMEFIENMGGKCV